MTGGSKVEAHFAGDAKACAFGNALDDEPEDHNESEQKGEETHSAKKVHGLFAKAADELHRQQIEKAIDEALPAKLGDAVFAGAMLHYFLPYFMKAGMLGQYGYEAVHLAIYLYALYHLPAVGFETAVHIVQLYAAEPAVYCIVQLGGQVFGDGIVVAHFFPATNEVETIVSDHVVEAGYLVGAVLQVGIHGDNYAAGCGFEAYMQGGAFAIVALEPDGLDDGVLNGELADNLPAAVGTAIVYHHDLVGVFVLQAYTLYPGHKFGQRFFFVEQWNDNREV